ncbi:MAG: YceI family protein [Deltaproteobacteria bacterium]|nr:YceI family protein [Deltaproteobacteria bacterium]
MNVHEAITAISVATVLAVLPACKQAADDQPKPAAPAAAPSPADATTTTTSKTPDARSAPAIAAGTDQPAVPGLPRISSWELDPENSSVTFVGKHANFTNVRGMFQKPSGTVVLDDATPVHSRITATIDVKSITTGVEERDTHLKSPEFFDAARYPVITFASTSVARSSDTAYEVTGNLTMHGVTKPVTLAVTASPPFQHFGTIRRGIEATTSVNRQDFGVGVDAWNVPAESGGLLIGDRVEITVDAELVLVPEPGKGH